MLFVGSLALCDAAPLVLRRMAGSERMCGIVIYSLFLRVTSCFLDPLLALFAHSPSLSPFLPFCSFNSHYLRHYWIVTLTTLSYLSHLSLLSHLSPLSLELATLTSLSHLIHLPFRQNSIPTSTTLVTGQFFSCEEFVPTHSFKKEQKDKRCPEVDSGRV